MRFCPSSASRSGGVLAGRGRAPRRSSRTAEHGGCLAASFGV